MRRTRANGKSELADNPNQHISWRLTCSATLSSPVPWSPRIRERAKTPLGRILQAEGGRLSVANSEGGNPWGTFGAGRIPLLLFSVSSARIRQVLRSHVRYLEQLPSKLLIRVVSPCAYRWARQIGIGYGAISVSEARLLRCHVRLCFPLGTPIIPAKLPIVKTGGIPTWRLTWQLGDRQWSFFARAWKIWWLMAQRRTVSRTPDSPLSSASPAHDLGGFSGPFGSH